MMDDEKRKGSLYLVVWGYQNAGCGLEADVAGLGRIFCDFAVVVGVFKRCFRHRSDRLVSGSH